MEPVKRDMELLSNSMATYAHIKGNSPDSQPEAQDTNSPVILGLILRFCVSLRWTNWDTMISEALF